MGPRPQTRLMGFHVSTIGRNEKNIPPLRPGSASKGLNDASMYVDQPVHQWSHQGPQFNWSLTSPVMHRLARQSVWRSGLRKEQNAWSADVSQLQAKPSAADVFNARDIPHGQHTP